MTSNYISGFDPKYFVQTDLVSDMLDAERRDLLDRIDKLESFVNERKKLMYENLTELDEGLSYASQRIAQAQDWNPYDHKHASDLERRFGDIQQQKQMEKNHTWSDIWNVNRELLELMKDYQQLRKREKLVK